MIFRDTTRNNVYERVPGAGKKELPMRARTMQPAHRFMFPVPVSSLFSSRGTSRISVNVERKFRLASDWPIGIIVCCRCNSSDSRLHLDTSCPLLSHRCVSAANVTRAQLSVNYRNVFIEFGGFIRAVILHIRVSETCRSKSLVSPLETVYLHFFSALCTSKALPN